MMSSSCSSPAYALAGFGSFMSWVRRSDHGHRSPSVLCGLLGVVDLQHFDRPPLRIELEPELLLQRGKQGRQLARGWRRIAPPEVAGSAGQRPVRHPLQVDVEIALKAGAID